MGYSGYQTTPPRPFRILLGGILFLACAAFGALLATHQFHRATAMQDGPVEMDWNTFVTNGPGDSAYVKITGVDLFDPARETSTIPRTSKRC